MGQLVFGFVLEVAMNKLWAIVLKNQDNSFCCFLL